LTAEVDLVLFLSLISGRNPQYLIEEHVRAVPFLSRHPVPTLSTGYILVDGGRVTSVEAVSQTRPLPADKPELVAAHATAARLIGMRAIYLDAGSGAPRPVDVELIRACRAAEPGLTLFVGGGIRSPEQVRGARAGGAPSGGGAGAGAPGGRCGLGGLRHGSRRAWRVGRERRGAPSGAGASRHPVTPAEQVRAGLTELAALATRVAEQQADAIATLADVYTSALRAGGTLLFAGNGGSAA